MLEVYRQEKGYRVSTEPPSVAELWKMPAPARVVILGKGPSLSSFAPVEYREWVVFALNEAVTARPGGMPVRVDYFVFIDAVAETIANVPESVIPIRGVGRRGNCSSLGYWFQFNRDLPPECARGGTAAKAACIIGEWVKRRGTGPIDLLFVGCDSWDNYGNWTPDTQYADCLIQIVGGRNKDYSSCNGHLGKVLTEYRTELIPLWFHREIAGGRIYSEAV